MTYFNVEELNSEILSSYPVQEFLFKMIKLDFGYEFISEYHQDIKYLSEYYLHPIRNNFFIAIEEDTDKIMGTLGVRAYDKDFPEFKGIYNSLDTASLWRVFVDHKWRRNGVASTLVQWGEYFAKKMGYRKVYLHTHKNIPGSLDFWLFQGYKIVNDTQNEFKTVHMEKDLD